MAMLEKLLRGFLTGICMAAAVLSLVETHRLQQTVFDIWLSTRWVPFNPYTAVYPRTDRFEVCRQVCPPLLAPRPWIQRDEWTATTCPMQCGRDV
jgi:hypothetical protein